jgi:hypothetical protein
MWFIAAVHDRLTNLVFESLLPQSLEQNQRDAI